MALADIIPALRSYLLADGAISAATGGARIYPVKLPQGVTAASIVVTQVSDIGDHHNEGASGLARPRIQIDCYAPDFDVARALALAVKERIDGYRGAMGSVAVRGVFFDGKGEGWEEDSALYRVRHDFFIWFDER